MARSVATIDSPQFINVKPYNPLISECEIKVLYVGENRNRSFISKEVATEMANSLPGCPIVGYFKEDKQDFSDHGQRVTIDDEGVHFESLTKPYGFVAPDAKIWFQKFQDTDDQGTVHEREYLMTTGYLWTGQYPEVQRVLNEEGNNQSMELDEKTLDGNWAMNNNTEIEFFIINDAIFSKLAILGNDVEPCFEGASVSAPKISSSFTMDDEFKTTLFSMMHDLQSALELSKGGLNMAENETTDALEQPIEGETTEFVAPVEEEKPEDQMAPENSEEVPAEEAPMEEEMKNEEDPEDEMYNKDPNDTCKTEANEDAAEVTVDEQNEEGTNFELETEFAAASLPIGKSTTWDSAAANQRVQAWAKNEDGSIDLQKYARAFLWCTSPVTKMGDCKLPFADIEEGQLVAIPRGIYAAFARLNQTDIPQEDKAGVLDTINNYRRKIAEQRNASLDELFAAEYAITLDELAELKEYKLAIEDEKKDVLIGSFYMLSDEDKAEIIENKSNYTLDEIEKELAVICVRKKVSFDLEEEVAADESAAVTFNLEDEVDYTPPMVQLLRTIKKDEI